MCIFLSILCIEVYIQEIFLWRLNVIVWNLIPKTWKASHLNRELSINPLAILVFSDIEKWDIPVGSYFSLTGLVFSFVNQLL